MQSKGRRTFLNVISIMGILAMMMLWPTGSQAQYARPQPRPSPQPSPPPSRSVPEPMTSVLLLLGIGLTGLTGYSLQRRKHGE
jgi:hypothetical protein